MKFLATIALAALALAPNVSAYFYTNDPVNTDVMSSGDQYEVLWEAKPEGDELSQLGTDYTVHFKTGGDIDQQLIAVITAEPIPISQTNFVFTVPDVAPGLYFLEYHSGGVVNWSTRFSVNGGTATYPVEEEEPTNTNTDASSAEPTPTPTGDDGEESSTGSQPEPTHPPKCHHRRPRKCHKF
ncbi:hypothetical protein H4R34_004950 [Dimargaris verticillata]|uniref:Yeast cell wall synthesis Kre9/Knh1-like N-terminal domain-containing protein n=1 Tax=Dimargaris verticillata TaxID=2761393 RepID=A0A9W8EB73_9FUNG|nr:hypothetical protein H4R34_004950 [Dimargaris verticillata]